MLNEEQLTELLFDLESDRVERTTSVSDTDKFCKAICAFANDLPNHRTPGYLLVGVKDNGSLSGLSVTDQLLQNLGAIRSDGNVLPQPVMSVARFKLQGGDVAVVEVQPSDMPPVRYKGTAWVRTGPRKGTAHEQDERVLTEKRVARAHTFDVLPFPEASLADLSLRLFGEYRAQVIAPEVIEANHRTIEEQLASLRLFDLSRKCPTTTGVLLFGNNPRYFLPGAYVQFLRFPGATMIEMPVDQAEISGDMRTVLDGLRDKFRACNQVGMKTGKGFQDQLSPDYPEWAIRELLHNAVIHRDYQSNTPIRFYWFSDHIEIQSPGGLYGEVTPETIMSRNSYRNPVMAEALKTMGYINRFGFGIQQAQKLLEENGNPPAEFGFEDRVVAVTIRRGVR
ncbi:MAG: putative DNA binding domain-containing protein [Nitrosomonadales bacterium]|nr:putative DNA binding domain-containing protein [Nitrosomonadales bacterium]